VCSRCQRGGDRRETSVSNALVLSDGVTDPFVWAMPLTGDRKPFAAVKPESADGIVTYSRLCIDGRWLAYSLRDSGRGDGKAIFYIGVDGQLQAGRRFWERKLLPRAARRHLFDLIAVTPG
jgi:hypothetical protein